MAARRGARVKPGAPHGDVTRTPLDAGPRARHFWASIKVEAAMSQGGLEGMFGQLMGGRSDGAGLENLLGKLRQQGLGDEVDSWVSTGPNRAVAPEQVQAALGEERLAGMAQQFGMPSGAMGGILAQLLPELVNRLTPNGHVPQQLPGGTGGIGGILSSILGGLLAGGMGGSGQGGGLGSILGGLLGGQGRGGDPAQPEPEPDAPRQGNAQASGPETGGGALGDLMRGLNRGR